MPLYVDIAEALLASPASSQEGNRCIMDKEKKAVFGNAGSLT